MNTDAKMRMERITRLLRELEYEVTRGILENEIDEQIGFQFVIPRSRNLPNGIVLGRFETRPTPSFGVDPRVGLGPQLKVVED